MEFAEVFGVMLADMDLARGYTSIKTGLGAARERVEDAAETYGGNDFLPEVNMVKASMAYNRRILAELLKMRDALGDWDMARLIAEHITAADPQAIRNVLLYHRDAANALFDVMEIPVSAVQTILQKHGAP